MNLEIAQCVDWLFMSDRFNWVHIGCFARRDISEDDTDEGADSKGYVDRPRWDAGWHTHKWYHKVADQSS